MANPNQEDPTERLGAAAKRRRESLYQGRDEGESERLEHVSSTRTSNYRWKFGEDPHDPDADPSSGYEYTKVEVVEDTSKTEKEKYGAIKGGQPSGVRCWACGQNDYLIIDERTAQEMIASHDETDWAQKMNRPLDFWRSQAMFMLFCPGCKAVTQLLAAVFRRQQAIEKEQRGG